MMLMILAVAMVGCATRGDLERLEALEMQNRAKADQAAMDAQDAKLAADQAVKKADEAEQRAAERERIADEKAKRADNAFHKSMRK